MRVLIHKLRKSELDFINSLLAYQEEYPQLTHNQWKVFLEIKQRYERTNRT